MAPQHFSAPPCAESPVPRPTPGSGVVHDNTRHTNRYTVVGNHLAQHRELTLVAIGLAVHIQSLPAGARIGIKCLTARFPESEARIASALRELEAAGYLERTRQRLPNGRVITRTVSHNQPGAGPAPARPALRPTPAPAPEPPNAPTAPAPPPTPKPPLPAPAAEDPARLSTAVALLAGLRREDPRLLLTELEIKRLAPAVSAWLERDVPPDAVHRALTARFPDDPRHPAAILAHRLTTQLPPPLPARQATLRPAPLQTCETCDRAFRSPAPGHCRGCRPDLKEAA
ncbi:helix-turn-helix domain-containing protein [Streptomyces sp. NPDC050428]|uniref:helix-turn-helix domain-containing protein n=1 Tax=Streptomyces sp. NPDC050428 TaxID=3155757 RepID=UPI00344125F2